MTASTAFSTAVTATVTINGVSAEWSITTMTADTTPDAFDFTDVINAALSTQYEASAVVTGFQIPLLATVSGGGAEIRKNSSGTWAGSVSVSSGETLNVRMTSSATISTTVTTVVSLGGVAPDWKITTTAPTCAGTQVGGHCWYLGAFGANCDTACSSHGGCDLAGTRDYAGSGGTLQNCQNVVSAFLPGVPAQNATFSAGVGCELSFPALMVRVITPTTACSAVDPLGGRFCACNN